MGVSEMRNDVRFGEMKRSPDERDDVEGRWVIRVTEELHQSVHNARGNFRELDGSDVDRLDE